MIRNLSSIPLIAAFFIFAIWNLHAFELSTTNLQGQKSSIGTYLSQNKWTLVMAWTTYCGECAKQYSMLSELHAVHKDLDLKVLGVSLDGEQNTQLVAEYRRQKKHQFPSVVANHTLFSTTYKNSTGTDFSGTPTYLLFDRQKILQAYLDGPITRDAIERFITQEDANL
jgi:thiol-disulfide isomerase/thioredoxin